MDEFNVGVYVAVLMTAAVLVDRISLIYSRHRNGGKKEGRNMSDESTLAEELREMHDTVKRIAVLVDQAPPYELKARLDEIHAQLAEDLRDRPNTRRQIDELFRIVDRLAARWLATGTEGPFPERGR